MFLIVKPGFPSISGKNTGMGCYFFLQGVFLTQGPNLCLLHWQADSLPLRHQGSPLLYKATKPKVIHEKWGG